MSSQDIPLAVDGVTVVNAALLNSYRTAISEVEASSGVSTLDKVPAPVADISMGAHRITNMGAPIYATDAATKAYVDSAASGGGTGAGMPAASLGDVLVGDNTSSWAPLSSSQAPDGSVLTRDHSASPAALRWALPASADIPVGTVWMYGGVTEPTGWKFCNGQTLSRSTYSALYTTIGNTYGAGDGVTNFNVPDLRGRTPIGASTSHALATTGGEEAHTLTTDEMPPHIHSVNQAAAYNSTEGMQNVADNNRNYVTSIVQNPTTTGSTGGSSGTTIAHNNMPPYLTLNFLIKH